LLLHWAVPGHLLGLGRMLRLLLRCPPLCVVPGAPAGSVGFGSLGVAVLDMPPIALQRYDRLSMGDPGEPFSAVWERHFDPVPSFVRLISALPMARRQNLILQTSASVSKCTKYFPCDVQ
jgi:hypothetical protein